MTSCTRRTAHHIPLVSLNHFNTSSDFNCVGLFAFPTITPRARLCPSSSPWVCLVEFKPALAMWNAMNWSRRLSFPRSIGVEYLRRFRTNRVRQYRARTETRNIWRETLEEIVAGHDGLVSGRAATDDTACHLDNGPKRGRKIDGC
jgi:hypothetical protein